MSKAAWVFCLFVVLEEYGLTLGEHGVADTSTGKVRGYTLFSRSGHKYTAFEGIPYARPPVGPLRFQPPVPADPWDGVRDAIRYAPHCLQMNLFHMEHQITGQEDCLYLSVYTKSFTGRAPVLVHIHGGAFVTGNGNYSEAQYLMDEDMVVVKINYRLGIFGFLSFESKELPGNQGMKDQVLGLKWIQENIANFGGNPDLVTIIGESAGAASVCHHIVSPLSRGLFHRAVAESGSSYTPWAVAPPGHGRSRAEKLMSLLGCPTTLPAALHCAQEKDAYQVVSKFEQFIEWQIDPTLTFGPVLESEGPDAFLVGPVSEFVHAPVPLLSGITSADGLIRTVFFLLTQTDFKWLSENFNKLAPTSLVYFATASKPEEVTERLRQFYLPDQEITINNWVNLTNLYTDSWFAVGSQDFANRHTGDVYFYYFDYIMTGRSLIPLDKDWLCGAFHVSEMGLLWNLTLPLTPNVASELEESLSKKFVKLVSDFTKYGTPTPEGSDMRWERWTNESNNYVLIDKNGFHPKEGLLKDRYKFWKTLNYRDKFNLS